MPRAAPGQEIGLSRIARIVESLYPLKSQLSPENTIQIAFRFSATNSGTELLNWIGVLWGVTYVYGSAGRLARIEEGGGRFYHYGYYGNSREIETVTISNAATGATTTYQQAHRQVTADGRLQGVSTRIYPLGAGKVAAHAIYKHDALGRREFLYREDGTYWKFGYNAKGEVTSGKKYLTATEAVLPGQQFEYDFDGIGNRDKARYGGDSSGANLAQIDYTPDALNLYTTIAHPRKKDIIARAPTSSTLYLDSSSTAMSSVGNWFRDVVEGGSSSAWTFQNAEIDDGTPPVDKTGSYWLPPSSRSPQHDADGNLTNDGRWVYTWNGENRLVQMETTSAAASADEWKRLVFAYDWKGRRITKTVYTGSSQTPTLDTQTNFVYDGWNLIGDWAPDGSGDFDGFSRTYVWGIDLSGTTLGAGGVGGLLSANVDEGASRLRYFPAYDGNGNIIAWNDEAGVVHERIDYESFGRVLVSEANTSGRPDVPFGFSTKYTDQETALCYYGYRYYDPVTGRWPSRDPIGERGGLNLYGFVGNDGIDRWDYLGLSEKAVEVKPVKQKCKIVILVGHARGIDQAKINRETNDRMDGLDMEDPDRVSCVTCIRKSMNEGIEKDSPEKGVPDHQNSRSNNYIFPGTEGQMKSHKDYDEERGDETVTSAYRKELLNAISEAKTMCSCCKVIYTYVKGMDDSGDDWVDNNVFTNKVGPVMKYDCEKEQNIILIPTPKIVK